MPPAQPLMHGLRLAQHPFPPDANVLTPGRPKAPNYAGFTLAIFRPTLKT
jgi:hypothetical protein